MKFNEMIEGCIKKDKRSQELFFKTYYNRLNNLSSRMSPKYELIDDFVQETFIKVFDNISKLKNYNEYVINAWCRTIIINLILDYIRKNKKYEFYDITKIKEGDKNDYDAVELLKIKNSLLLRDNLCYYDEEFELIFNKDEKPDFTVDDIKKAADNLSPVYGKVFNLYVIKGYNHKQISEKLKISVGSSKSNLSKAKRNLREQLINN